MNDEAGNESVEDMDDVSSGKYSIESKNLDHY